MINQTLKKGLIVLSVLVGIFMIIYLNQTSYQSSPSKPETFHNGTNCEIVDTVTVVDSITVKRVVKETVFDTIHKLDTVNVVMLDKKTPDFAKKRVYPHLLLFVHCSATRGSIPLNCEQINSIAYQRFGILSYHYIIQHDGQVCYNYADDSPNLIMEDEVFAGAKYYNRISQHIVYVGGVDDRLKAKNTLTEMQKHALLNEIRRLLTVNPNLKIVPHFTVAQKDCPSFDVAKFLEENGMDNSVVIQNERQLRKYIRSKYQYF